jgi:hypothetical protein
LYAAGLRDLEAYSIQFFNCIPTLALKGLSLDFCIPAKSKISAKICRKGAPLLQIL